MSAIPQAVRRQAARAEQLAAEHRARLNGTAPPAAGTPGAAPVLEHTPPVVTPPAPAPAPAAAAPVPGTPAADEATWERRFKVLQGKYNAEVPRLQQQLNGLADELKATRGLLASMTSEPRQPQPAAPPAPPPAPTRLVTDQETQAFGADLIDVMRRVVREETAGVTAEIDRRLQPVHERVDQVAATAQATTKAVAKRSKQAVDAHMDERCPQWRELNEDPEFLVWLDQVDPFSGKERGELLVAAYKAFDAARVEAFFVGYLKEHAAVSPPAPTPTPTPVPAPAVPAQGTQVTLESLVAPGTPKPGAPRTPDGSEKRIWTRKEISDFYRLANSGKFKGTLQERKAIEADIFTAQTEGRIR